MFITGRPPARQKIAAIMTSANTKNLNAVVHNRGLNGALITDIRDGGIMYNDTQPPFDTVMAQDKPTIVIFYCGFNDYNRGKSLTTYSAVLSDLVQRCLDRNVKVCIATESVHTEDIMGTSKYCDFEKHLHMLDKET